MKKVERIQMVLHMKKKKKELIFLFDLTYLFLPRKTEKEKTKSQPHREGKITR